MRTDRIARLLRLRRQTATEAKQALAAALATESLASRVVEAATVRIALEAELALGDTSGDLAVETYIKWLPVGRRVLANADLGRTRAMEDVMLARAALSTALSSERAAERAMADALAAEAGQRERRETALLDEVGRGIDPAEAGA